MPLPAGRNPTCRTRSILGQAANRARSALTDKGGGPTLVSVVSGQRPADRNPRRRCTVLKTSIKLLALGVLMFGAASTASACGDEKKDNAQASYTSTSGSTCASKMSKEECAAKMAAGGCSMSKGASATVASAEHCAGAKGAMAECT